MSDIPACRPKLLSMDDLIAIEKAAEEQAFSEAIAEIRRTIYLNHCRIFRRTRELDREYAKRMLSPEQYEEYRRSPMAGANWVPSSRFEQLDVNLFRLSPEGDFRDARFEAILQKHANLPLRAKNGLCIDEFATIVDVAKESVELSAYPGTADARKRYAMAFRRYAGEMADTEAAPLAARLARNTLRLALDDRSVTVWAGLQGLVDAAGMREDGSSMPAAGVSEGGWQFIWTFTVIAKLRRDWPESFASVLNPWDLPCDEQGRILDDNGRPLLWIWRMDGTGILSGEYALQNGRTYTRDGFFHASEVACRLLAKILDETTLPVSDGADEATGNKPTHNADFTEVKWFGKRYAFTKGIQSRAIEMLWVEFEKGGFSIHEKTIGEKTESSSERFRLRDVFRNHPAWGTMIQTAETKGCHRIAKPESLQNPQ